MHYHHRPTISDRPGAAACAGCTKCRIRFSRVWSSLRLIQNVNGGDMPIYELSSAGHNILAAVWVGWVLSLLELASRTDLACLYCGMPINGIRNYEYNKYHAHRSYFIWLSRRRYKAIRWSHYGSRRVLFPQIAGYDVMNLCCLCACNGVVSETRQTVLNFLYYSK